MELAEVIGSVTSTVKAESLARHKLLLVRSLDPESGALAGSGRVAVDTVGAGPGERVLVVAGSGARQAPSTRSVATDLTIVAIVDSVDLADAVAIPKTKNSVESKRSSR